MASSKEYRDFVLEQFDMVPGLLDHISCRAMMGEFVLYYDGVVFGGIYDDRLLVKKVPGLSDFGMSEAIPYEGGKAMYLVECVDEPELLAEIVWAVERNSKNKAHFHNETRHIKTEYDFNCLALKCFGVKLDWACELLANIEQFSDGRTDVKNKRVDGPDIRSRVNGDIYGVEHFEYDASLKNRNGSAERREIDRDDDSFKRMIGALEPGGKIEKIFSMKTRATPETFKNNFLRSFREHSGKIQEYKKNLKTKKVWFFAEDSSSMSPTIFSGLVDGCSEHLLLPVFYKDIEEEILSADIEGIIFASTFPINNHMIFVRNNKKSYSDLRKYYNFSDETPVQFYNGGKRGYFSYRIS